MRWRRAWTGELSSGQYTKLDVTLDPEDLERLVAEHLPGLEPSKLTVREAWQLLELEAETLLAVEQMVRLGHNIVGNQELLSNLRASRVRLLAALRTKHGLTAPDEPAS
jgi:hypothetical protein